jgi:hypothetical protein
VIVWLPLAGDGTLNDAWPPESVAGAPIGVVSSRNWTVPVGDAAPALTGATVALKVTADPAADGDPELVTVTVVAPRATVVCAVVLDAFVQKPVSDDWKVAEMTCDPSASKVSSQVAAPS